MIDAPKPKNERISMLCYFDWLNSFELMSDEQIGKLIKHILIYGKSLYDGVEIAPPSDPNINYAYSQVKLKFIFQFIKGQIDRDYLKWARKCEQNSENARKRTQSIDTNPNNS